MAPLHLEVKHLYECKIKTCYQHYVSDGATHHYHGVFRNTTLPDSEDVYAVFNSQNNSKLLQFRENKIQHLTACAWQHTRAPVEFSFSMTFPLLLINTFYASDPPGEQTVPRVFFVKQIAHCKTCPSDHWKCDERGHYHLQLLGGDSLADLKSSDDPYAIRHETLMEKETGKMSCNGHHVVHAMVSSDLNEQVDLFLRSEQKFLTALIWEPVDVILLPDDKDKKRKKRSKKNDPNDNRVPVLWIKSFSFCSSASLQEEEEAAHALMEQRGVLEEPETSNDEDLLIENFKSALAVAKKYTGENEENEEEDEQYKSILSAARMEAMADELERKSKRTIDSELLRMPTTEELMQRQDIVDAVKKKIKNATRKLQEKNRKLALKTSVLMTSNEELKEGLEMLRLNFAQVSEGLKEGQDLIAKLTEKLHDKEREMEKKVREAEARAAEAKTAASVECPVCLEKQEDFMFISIDMIPPAPAPVPRTPGAAQNPYAPAASSISPSSCGHMLCGECLEELFRGKKPCPVCNRPMGFGRLRVFLGSK